MNLIKSTGTFSFFTIISRILGYLRDLLISSQNYSELEELDSQVFLMDYINGELVNPRIKVDI